MIFFDIFYNIIIYPIEFIIEILFYLFSVEFKSSYGVSLFLLSLCINFLSLPLYNIAESWQAKERAIQDKMKPMIDNIKAVYKGDQRYLLIRTCQRINGYKTIYAFRGTLGLLIQIPFFMAAYNFVHSLSGLSGQSFLFIKDLSKPDALIHIGNISINLLPFLMTLFSLLASFVYSRKLKFKESLPLYIVSLIFLLLLYNSPSGLLFYWTINCLFSFIKNIIIEFKLYEIFVRNRYKLLKAYNIFFIIVALLIISLSLLSNIERKAYLTDFNEFRYFNGVYTCSAKVVYYSKIFRTSDIFGIKGNVEKIPNFVSELVFPPYNTINTIYVSIKSKENIEDPKYHNIEIYYKLYLKSYVINIFVLLLILLILFNLKNIFDFIFTGNSLKLFLENRNKLIFLSSSITAILSGIFILSSIISSSVQEFNEPFYLIINNLSISIGIFFFYPIFIYLLFQDDIKNYITLFYIFLIFIIFINVFIMVGNYGNINSNFSFDNAGLLISNYKDILLSIFYILICVSFLILVLKKNKIKLIINLYYIIFIVLVLSSVFNIFNISKEYNKLNNTEVYNDLPNNGKIFNLSKNGNNIFVFILDRAASFYWIDSFDRYPEYKDEFDGFVFFTNNVSYSATTVTISSLYGGYDNLPYEMSTNGIYNITNFHNKSLFMMPLSLEKYNYKSVMLEPTYANFSWIPDLSIFNGYSNIKAYNENSVVKYSINKYLGFTNINIDDFELEEQKSKSIRFSILRMIPVTLRYNFYDNNNWFLSSSIRVSHGMYKYAMLLYTKDFINIEDDGNYFNIIHSMITHPPLYINSDYLPYNNANELLINNEDLLRYKDDYSVEHFYANVAAMNCIIEFLNYLKENNLYDNTKIIIVSDHADNLNNDKFSDNISFASKFNALLMYKDFNSNGTIKLDGTFSTIADVPYLTTKHISGMTNVFNGKLITNDYKNNGVFILDMNSAGTSEQYSNRYNFDRWYYVKDNIFNINNWKKFEIDWKTGVSKEIELK
ncbi:membrane protein insertase YidC [Brachyspira hyodysenteriae]|uniref:membrane protein insertase YidC n=2 Tax=Brachyspira hyodysenteriae TaxID=159 RepID=UPI0011845CCE|nr:membrane protein insertase YidC [Brachyspira hyodysenteriae]